MSVYKEKSVEVADDAPALPRYEFVCLRPCIKKGVPFSCNQLVCIAHDNMPYTLLPLQFWSCAIFLTDIYIVVWMYLKLIFYGAVTYRFEIINKEQIV